MQSSKELQGETRKSYSDQCKEIEGNNRMGKTRELFKKIRESQGNISCKDGHNKRQKRKGEIYPFEGRVPKKSKER